MIFVTPDDEAISFYGDFKGTLTSKYGDPAHTFSFYSYPYTDDDPEAEHETAISVGKGTLLRSGISIIRVASGYK